MGFTELNNTIKIFKTHPVEMTEDRPCELEERPPEFPPE